MTAIGKEVGFVHQTIRNLITRYQEGELSAILNEKRGGRRRPYLIVEEEQDFLKEQFERALDGEFITIQELFDADQKRVGRKTTRQGFYALLKRHGWRKVTPRPVHPKQTPRSLKRLKIKSIFGSACKRSKHSRRYKKVRLMYQDGADFGRISKLGTCWALQGVRPIVASHHIREFRYCYGPQGNHS